MILSTKFVSATLERSTVKKNIPAPYMRRDFIIENAPEAAEITVSALGFYELYVNGKRLTKGLLSPYISNPDELICYDTYDITEYLVRGENTVAFLLGCGMQNCFGGFVWDFQDARFSSAPKLAFALEMKVDGEEMLIEADEAVLCHPSPLYFNDLRMGEKYDARREIPNWSLPCCDLAEWTPAIPVRCDAGDTLLAYCKPIVAREELKAVSIWEEDGGFVYDFGFNQSGLTRLTVNGKYGQHITVDHCERLSDGKFSQSNLVFVNPKSVGMPKYTQRTEYICSGAGEESYTPRFTYYGFRYAKVTGITREQATPELLTYVVMNTELTSRGDFSCSDPTLTTLQEMTRRSTLSNFFHFPNDCPHREKNGWTADAALSAEQTIMNFDPEGNYAMWMEHIVRAMDSRGALPGIVPTGGWGFHWGNGPAWDSVLIYLPYFTALLRDDLRSAKIASGAILRYFHYLRGRCDEQGLIAIGLGDWVPPDKSLMPPLVFTDSVITYDLARKAAYLYRRLGMELEACYCDGFAEEMLSAIREHLIEDKDTMRFIGGSQSAEAMAIYYGICINEDEKRRALDTLVREIHRRDDFMTTGVLGGRVIFRVLCDYGYEDLAVKMIARPESPSYGAMIKNGETTLTEHIACRDSSHNHHFWGDISALMIEYFGGIRINPEKRGADTALIAPVFPSALDSAKAHHNSVCGRIATSWHREGDKVVLALEIPCGMDARITAPVGYALEGGERTAESGVYHFNKI